MGGGEGLGWWDGKVGGGEASAYRSILPPRELASALLCIHISKYLFVLKHPSKIPAGEATIGVRIEEVRIEGVRIEGVKIEGVRIEGVKIEGVRIEGVKIERGED